MKPPPHIASILGTSSAQITRMTRMSGDSGRFRLAFAQRRSYGRQRQDISGPGGGRTPRGLAPKPELRCNGNGTAVAPTGAASGPASVPYVQQKCGSDEEADGSLSVDSCRTRSWFRRFAHWLRLRQRRGAPPIESESASKITSTDATLEAMINPGDAPNGVYYQFQIASDPAEYESELACPPEPSSGPFLSCSGAPSLGALPIGFVPASSEPTSVSLDLASAGVILQPGAIYHYRVLAAKAVLTEDTIEWESPPVVGADQTFSTSPKPPPTIDPDPQVGGASQSSAPQIPFLSQPHRHHRRHHRKRNRQALHRGNVGQASLAG